MDEWICPNCGEKMSLNFCTNCGTPKIEDMNALPLKNKNVLSYPDGTLKDFNGNYYGTYKKDEENNIHIFNTAGDEEIYNSDFRLIKEKNSNGDEIIYDIHGHTVIYASNGDIIKKDSNGEEYLRLRKDGSIIYNNKTYKLSNGKYVSSDRKEIIKIDDDENIIIENNDGSIVKEYNKYGKLIQTTNGNTTNNLEKLSKIEKDNNGYSVTRYNHIEYDEESYNTILRTLNNINNSYNRSIKNECNSVENTINNFPDKYSNSSINSIGNSISSHFDLISSLSEATNYSLLAYQACDDSLKDNLNNLIDLLFEEKEAATAFKKSINFTIEDRDKDGVLEYKMDTDFGRVSKDLIPTQKYIDSNGNILYFNENGYLISSSGNNITIDYGGEKFNLSFGNNGCVILKDKNGNPLNIFGEYNIESKQYGGNQMDFLYRSGNLLSDDNINNIIDRYFPDATYEEKNQYLHKICNTGCGYTAMGNVVFKMMEGYEEEFKNNFGFPMYNVKLSGGVLKVDYNYEPVILELYSETFGKYNSIKEAITRGNGIISDIRDSLYDYICEKYNILNYNKTDVHIVGDNGYNLYYCDGRVCVNSGGGHSMIVTEETDSGVRYVSSWGEKFIYEDGNLDNPYVDTERVFSSGGGEQ